MNTRLPRPGHVGLSAAASALALLVATTLSASQAADAGDARTPAATPATASTTVTQGDSTVALPNLRDPSYTVTLATGDQVTLTAAGAGHYSVTATPAAGNGPAMSVNAHGGPHSPTTVTAAPFAAGTLVADRIVDRNLFDVTWLAAHGDTGPRARIPVTVQYAGHHTAATLASRAAALPGARLAASHPANGTIDVTVPASGARRFWAALTGTTATSGTGPTTPGPSHLAGGATHAWTTGHPSPTTTRPAASQALQHVTEVIKGIHGAQLGLDSQYLVGVAGGGLDNIYPAGSRTCLEVVDGHPWCDLWQVGFDVPVGVYSASGTGWFDGHQRFQNIHLLDPQITVAGDTSVTLDVNTAQEVGFDTPRPSEAFTAHFDDYRTTVDGTWFSTLSFGAVSPHYWATVTAPVSLGTFHLTAGWVLGEPPLTMTMTTPKRLHLDATYWTYKPYPAAGHDGAVRFASRRNVQVVYAGHGSAEDFAAVDARGKLALITVKSFRGCTVYNDQLDNAIHAGAVGVLVDTNDPAQVLGRCPLLLFPEYDDIDQPSVPDIPFAQLAADQATMLIGLLAHGTVEVDVDSYPRNTPYLYTLSPSWEGRVPDSLHVTVSDAQLKPVTDHFHAAPPRTATLEMATWRPNEWFVGATPETLLALPDSIQELEGPISPDTVRQRFLLRGVVGLRTDVVGDNRASVEHWNAEPRAPGAQAVSAGILDGQPGKWDSSAQAVDACAFCRQGSSFYPLGYMVSGSDPGDESGFGFGFAGNDIHLYRNGDEIPQTVVSGFVSYQLPDQKDTYQLTLGAAGTHTTWDFTSAAPTSGHKPAGYGCVGTFLGSTGPCEAEPLVLLRYDAHTDLANALTAGGVRHMDVTVYHQAADAPRPTSLKVWTSTDGGKTWHPASVSGGRDGAYSATYILPTLAKTNGKLSIRAQATDAGGNDVTQILTDAVTLTSGH